MVDDILEKGFERDGIKLPSIKPPIPFDEFNRSFCFHIHAWEPLTFLLQAHSQFGDAKYLDASFDFAWDWFTRYQAALLTKPRGEALHYAAAHKRTQAWYDMGVGQRAYRLAYLIDAAARLPEKYPDEAIGQLYESLQFHHQLLSNDSFFVGHTNHGLYQALGQLAAAHRFLGLEGQEAYYEIASRRLHVMIDGSFFPSATHREHSPGYHHMILGSLLGARRSKLLDQELDAFLGEAESVMSWMIAPDGSLANFGDTDHKKRVYTPPHPLEYEDRHIKHLWSGGRGGERPEPGMKHLADAGYVFSRTFHDGEPVSKASYFAQAAGFHSRTHKHADHMTFLWHEGGRQLLADAGRYAYAGRTELGSDLFEDGFWYSDPKRVYVESTRAHNCVEIDGKSYRRKGARRFGSAVRYAGEQDGLLVTECEATHFRTVRHRRVLVMAPGRFLLVLDWLNDRTMSHDYRQWFQFAPDWHVTRGADGLTARAEAAGDVPAQTVSVFNLIAENAFADPARGQEEPQLQGWWSNAAYSLVPSTSIHVEALARPMARFATLFALSGDLEIDRAATGFNPSMREGRIVWREGDSVHTLSVRLGKAGKVSVSETQSRLGLAVLPSGGLVSFGGQSGQQLIARLEAGAGEGLGGGVEGHVKAGYAFARLHAPGVQPLLSNASYLAQNAAFHSPALKHADHLSFLWHEGRRAVLGEAGHYEGDGAKTEPGSDLFEEGFLFADPKRIYAESTRAHNCVEIDGRSYPRKGAKRFGSALRYAGKQGGMAVTDCEVTHQRTVRHRRVLIMAPGRFLLVLDWLNDRTQSHDYRQWFQFAPDWHVARGADGLTATAEAQGGVPAQTVSVFNLIAENSFADPARGQEEPQLQGWWSNAAYSLVPSTSVNVEALARPMARFATMFALDPDMQIDVKGTRFNATLRSGKVRWSDAAGRHLLTVTMAEAGKVTVTLENV